MVPVHRDGFTIREFNHSVKAVLVTARGIQVAVVPNYRFTGSWPRPATSKNPIVRPRNAYVRPKHAHIRQNNPNVRLFNPNVSTRRTHVRRENPNVREINPIVSPR